MMLLSVAARVPLLLLPSAVISFTATVRRSISSRAAVPGLGCRRPTFVATAAATADDAYETDLAIVGAGPSGLSLAAEASKRNLTVHVVDPALHDPWPNNYGVWIDEVESLGYTDCLDLQWPRASVVFDEKESLTLDRPYGRVDRKKLKGRLLSECDEALVSFTPLGATAVGHDAKGSTLTLSDGSTLTAKLVVDATGFSRKFTDFGPNEFDPGYQVTYGVLAEMTSEHGYPLDELLLMDWCEGHLVDLNDPDVMAASDRFPSFLYGMPVTPTRVFLEETILVSRPAGSSPDLERRLHARLKQRGLTIKEILEDERAAIPMGGCDPVVPQRCLCVGATASMVHPASGYMVARALELAPKVADALARGLAKVDAGDATVEDLGVEGWDAVWGADDRRQRDFMSFGCELLCQLRPQELRDFFTGFFRLPDALWEAFLSWRLTGVGHVWMGLLVWAQCIPRRFVPVMLWKSLPYVFSHLVGPFSSRGLPVRTDSLYTEETVWGPDAYYKEEERLRERTATVLHKRLGKLNKVNGDANGGMDNDVSLGSKEEQGKEEQGSPQELSIS